MATQIIPNRDGRTFTQISDTYAPYGEVPTTPSRPDDPAQWTPELWDTDFMCKRYGCTVDDLQAWSGDGYLALPKAEPFSVGINRVVWRRNSTKVLEVESRVLGFAARIPQAKKK